MFNEKKLMTKTVETRNPTFWILDHIDHMSSHQMSSPAQIKTSHNSTVPFLPPQDSDSDSPMDSAERLELEQETAAGDTTPNSPPWQEEVSPEEPLPAQSTDATEGGGSSSESPDTSEREQLFVQFKVGSSWQSCFYSYWICCLMYRAFIFPVIDSDPFVFLDYVIIYDSVDHSSL